MVMSTFEKRDVSDHGKSYEYYTCALFGLKFALSDEVADFQMYSNCAKDGIFDDIKIETSFKNGQRRSFLFQLKHREKDEDILPFFLMKEIVKNRKSKFYIPKYIEALKALQTDEEDKIFIIYTNAKVQITKGDKLMFKNYKTMIVDECEELDYQDLLLNRRGDKSEIFQFKYETAEEGMEEILKKFYFFTKQKNLEETKNAVEKQLKSLIDAVNIFNLYIKFMEDWWNRNFILDKHMLLIKLAEFTLSPYVRTLSGEHLQDKTILLKKAVMDFELTVVDESQEDTVRKIWTELEEQENWKIMPWYNLNSPHLEFLNIQKIIILWHERKIPLVVKIDHSNEKLIRSVTKLLHKDLKHNSVILVGKVKREDFPGLKLFENLCDVIKKDFCLEILRNFYFSIQGRGEICLEKFIDAYKGIEEYVTTKELIEMSRKDFLLIGFKTSESFDIHIPRHVLATLVPINTVRTFYENTRSNALVLINCDESFKEKFSFLLKIPPLEISEFVENRIDKKLIMFSTKRIYTYKEFDEICKKAQTSNACMLQVINDGYCILLAAKPTHYFLSPQFQTTIPEDRMYHYFKNPLKVFCAPPGIGKSRFMKILSRKCPRERWVIYADLISHNSFLSENPDPEKIWYHFLELDQESVLTKQFKSNLRRNKNVEVFLDGLDELDSENVKTMIEFIKFLSLEGVSVWVSARESLRERILQEGLNVLPIELKQLDKEQQAVYIQEKLDKKQIKHTNTKYKPDEIKEIIDVISCNVDVTNSQELLGIPLQLYIITEILLTSRKLYENLRETNIMVLTKMYDFFFKGRMSSEFEKVGLNVEQGRKLMRPDDRFKHYEILGLQSCLDEKDYKKLHIDEKEFKEFLEELKNFGDRYGIVRKIDGDKVVFDHQTFGEYFSCVYFKKNKHKIMLLRDEIFSERYENLRRILSIMLGEDSPLHLAIIYKNLEQFEKYFEEGKYLKDKGGRSPLHLSCGIGKQNDLSNEISNYGIYERETDFFKTIIGKLVEETNVGEPDEFFGFNCVQYAVKSGCIYAVEEFFKKKKDCIELYEALSDCNISVLMDLAAQCGYINLFKKLKEKYPESVEEYEKREKLLKMAIFGCKNDEYTGLRRGNIEIVEELIKTGLNLNLEVDFNEYILDSVCVNAVYDILYVLLKNGAICYGGNTILHRLAQFRRRINDAVEEAVKYFNIDVNKKNDDGVIALHYSCENVDIYNVQKLMEIGADPSIADNNKDNALHYSLKSCVLNRKTVIININDNVDALNTTINKALIFPLIAIKNTIEIVRLFEVGNNLSNSSNDNTCLIKLNFDWKNITIDGSNIRGNIKMDIMWENGIIEMIKRLPGSFMDTQDEIKNEQGVKNLNLASKLGITEIINQFLKFEQDVKYVQDNQNFPPCASRSNEESEVIKLSLMCETVNVNDKSENLFLLYEDKNVKLCLSKSNSTNNKKNNKLVVMSQSAADNTKVVNLLLEDTRIDVNTKNMNGKTPLHMACEGGLFENVEDLITKGADVTIQDNEDNNSLHYASKCFDSQLSTPSVHNNVMVLLLNHVNEAEKTLYINSRNKGGISPLHVACENQKRHFIEYLLNNGADVNCRDNESNTPLHYTVCSNEDESLVQRLLQKGVDVDIQNKDGTTGLHLACLFGQNNVVKKLLYCSKISTVDSNGNSVLHYAAESKEDKTEVIDLLLEREIDVNCLNCNGKTALELARERGHVEKIRKITEFIQTKILD